MAPTSERTAERAAPTKKSLRLWVKNNGHVMRKESRVTYVYPRTVEAAKDPFECATGKNKMFFLIAINVFPESKIVKPDESESETEMEETSQIETECSMEENNSKFDIGKEDKIRKRAKRSPTIERTIQNVTETNSPHSCTTEDDETSKSEDPVSQTEIVCSVPAKKARQRVRKGLIPKRKTSSKVTAVAVKENNEECSKVSDCENRLSSQESVESNQGSKTKGNEAITKRAALNSRKLPAIPTIMNSLNKIIETCSATGAISFSLAKKKPRQSRS